MPVSERPILFSTPMIKALLEGHKTQTRRAMKWDNHAGVNLAFSGLSADHIADVRWALYSRDGDGRWQERARANCPYGKPGDRLIVREDHYRFGHWEPVPGVKTKTGRMKWKFVPDSEEYRFDAPETFRKGRHHKDSSTPAWHKRLGRFMPRKLSRITLEITDIRVQRLQDISEEDAKEEGAFFTNYGRNCFHGQGVQGVGNCPAPDKAHPLRDGWSMVETSSHENCLGSPRMAFANLWNSINGAGSWDKNPWLWALTFRRIAKDNHA